MFTIKNKSTDKQVKSIPVEIKNVDKENNRLDAVFSTEDTDRHGDTVKQTGWDLKPFKENPVIINSHDYEDAAKVVGKCTNIGVINNQLQGTIEFAVDENPVAKTIFDLYDGGYLHAFSVGFKPVKFAEDEDGNTDYFTVEEAELLEVSAVSVPANARALAKKKGIDVENLPEDVEKDVDNEEDEVENEKEQVESEEEEAPDEEPEEEEVEEEPEEEVEQEEPEVEEEEVVENNVDNSEEEEEESDEEKAIKAIENIKAERREKLKKAKKAIGYVIKRKVERMNLDKDTKEKIRKRKINQAIRSLTDAK